MRNRTPPRRRHRRPKRRLRRPATTNRPDDPATRILGLIGLGVRGGSVAIGVGAARAAMQRGDARVLVLAADASPRTLAKVERLAAGTGVPIIHGPLAEQLGARLGRPPVMAVAVRDRELAKGLLAIVARDGA